MVLMLIEYKIAIDLYLGLKFSDQCRTVVPSNHFCDG